jgi:hypothetical protein
MRFCGRLSTGAAGRLRENSFTSTSTRPTSHHHYYPDCARLQCVAEMLVVTGYMELGTKEIVA